ncbi:helix-turn-helix domain-containing protein [Luteimonas sp. 50]|uniref:Helix-turn-helix domain-containing protein n=1 Tax=Cognatiluteimonas sedimenti TaxID=2927791 RepID=A0ABT0A297_9GAMM|nr:helix-turn-helix domain-containing protein [Lysobacter sedimenti]MCJ0825101.1 helix-turn-helix domain-containing protein [Lysobacter sedimenti]
MKISEAAAVSGCHLETIRYYEHAGLMPQARRKANGYRDYGEEDVNRLRFISRGRELGFSLDEIRSLLRLGGSDAMLSCSEIDVVARGHLADIRSKIRELTRMAKELEHTINACSGGTRGQCAILGALRHPRSPAGTAMRSTRAADPRDGQC